MNAQNYYLLPFGETIREGDIVWYPKALGEFGPRNETMSDAIQFNMETIMYGCINDREATFRVLRPMPSTPADKI